MDGIAHHIWSHCDSNQQGEDDIFIIGPTSYGQWTSFSQDKNLFKANGMSHVTSEPYHPIFNYLAEKIDHPDLQTAVKKLTKWSLEEGMMQFF